MNICQIEGCPNTVHARQYCNMHYRQYMKNGKSMIYESVKDLENEIWKDVIDYDGMYKISNKGRVKSIKFLKEILLSPIVCTNGYLEYHLYKNKKRRVYLAHRLVAIHFIPNDENKPEVNHKNEKITDNDEDNLEWVTAKENANYGSRIERCASKRRKKVFQYTLDGILVKEWESVSDANRNGFTGTQVSRCALGKCNAHKGYKWSYTKLI